MTHPTEVIEGTDTHGCGCCGRQFPAGRVAELGVTPGVYICAGCAFWAARRAGILSALRGIPLRTLLPRPARRQPQTVRATIPVLPSSDLARTAAFYAAAGLVEVERTGLYLVLHNHGIELHFALEETVVSAHCLVHVADATKMWKLLHHLGADGVGEIADRDYGLRDFVWTDPDGNRIRIGSPRP